MICKGIEVKYAGNLTIEATMTIAVFKPGGEVWGKLSQKVIDMAELPAHVAEGWFESAQDALDAHDLAKLEAENVALEAQIAAEQVKLDGRTKAARDLKAKQVDQGNGIALPEVTAGSVSQEIQVSRNSADIGAASADSGTSQSNDNHIATPEVQS